MIVLETTGKMNNGIMMKDNLPESHKNGRRTGNPMINETMTTHCRGSRASHETRGRNNFGIMNMMDEHGNSVPEGTIKTTQVWFHDGQS